MIGNTEHTNTVIYALLYTWKHLGDRSWRIYVGKSDRLQNRINSHLERKDIRCLFVLKRGCQDAEKDEQMLTEAICLEMNNYMHVEGGQYVSDPKHLRVFYSHNLNLCNYCLQEGHYSNFCPNRQLSRPERDEQLDEKKAEDFLKYIANR